MKLEPTENVTLPPTTIEETPTAAPRRVSRRWLIGGALSALGGGCASPVNPLAAESELDTLVAGGALGGDPSSLPREGGAADTQAGLPPQGIDGGVFSPPVDAVLRLVNRITFGYSRAEYQAASTLGYTAYLEQQLNPQTIDDSQMAPRLAAFDTLTMTSQQIFDTYRNTSNVPVQQLVLASIVRQTFSKRQLLERMVEFWSDHFNIDILDEQCRFLKLADDRDVIRVHALGKFPDLLRASARSAAMLFYLDNYINVAGSAQENYAREVCELHTMGVNGGYTQQDVQEIARCFTGWTFRGGASGQFGTFFFNAAQHDNGPKTVLGVSIPAGGGVNDGEAVISILASHPSTANFIARKLTALFLGYNPDPSLVARVAQTYAATNGDIKSMLRVILDRKPITQLLTPKLKRPTHHMAALLRAMNAIVTNPQPLATRLDRMGQRPFHWPAPNGYPDSLGAWGSNLLPRWQTVVDLIENRVSGTQIDAFGLFESQGGTAPGQAGRAINRLLTGGALSAAAEAAIQSVYDAPTGSQLGRTRDAFGVAASMQGYQWY